MNDNSPQPNHHHVTLHKPKKPWYKRVWVWIGIVVLIGIIGGAGTPKDSSNTSSQPNNTAEQTKAEPAKEEKQPEAWDIEVAYAKVTNGMTKAEVEAATGKPSDSCTENDSEYLGKTEYCSYGNPFIDKGSISVTYNQGKVSSKTKSKY